jgi:putative intracellular protease/amidase
MTRIAYLVTSAREMTLADGTPHPTGYFAEEALTPYERFEAAGFDVTVITPDGQPCAQSAASPSSPPGPGRASAPAAPASRWPGCSTRPSCARKPLASTRRR